MLTFSHRGIRYKIDAKENLSVTRDGDKFFCPSCPSPKSSRLLTVSTCSVKDVTCAVCRRRLMMTTKITFGNDQTTKLFFVWCADDGMTPVKPFPGVVVWVPDDALTSLERSIDRG